MRKEPYKTTQDFHNDRKTQGKNVGVINLGCARNLVDAQVILGHLKRTGHHIVEVEKSNVVVVNTCAFIEEAKKESIDTILDLLELKKQGKIKKVIVAGCLAQRYADELANEFKGIDAIVGAQQLQKEDIPDQVSLTPGHFAYVKICESCFNRCSFCAIPGIKGKFSSRTVESIISEIKKLDEGGVKEINLIGQDITAYGMDLYKEKSLARLLKELIPVTRNIQWIRLLYAFPAHVTDELIKVITEEEKICKYIDIPLQHISDHLLKSMNRSITAEQTKNLIKKIRTEITGASLRTTFIVGMPGETEENFQELLDFVQQERFERVGVFVYSREEGTAAYDMLHQVPASIAKKRLDTLMRQQHQIAKKYQTQFVGKKLRVLIDEQQKNDKAIYLGRSQYDAPEVDGVVYVHSKKSLKPGDFVDCKITDAYEYDLAGEVGT